MAQLNCQKQLWADAFVGWVGVNLEHMHALSIRTMCGSVVARSRASPISLLIVMYRRRRSGSVADLLLPHTVGDQLLRVRLLALSGA